MKNLILVTLFAVGLIFRAEAQTQVTGSLTNGLVAYYPLRGNFDDISGNANNLTQKTKGISFTSDRFGNSDFAVLFSLTNDSVQSIRDLPIIGNQNRTISIWACFKSDANNSFGNCAIFSYGSTPTATTTLLYQPPGWAFNWNVFNNWGWGFQFHHEDRTLNCKPTPIILNKWHHISYVYSGNILSTKVFVDGILVDTAPSTLNKVVTLNTSNGPLVLGENYRFPTMPGMSLSDIRIYNRALSSNEVASLYAVESKPTVMTDTFGSGTNQFGIDFVTVGNPGNSNDKTGYGGVPYSYRIGKYTISQNQVNAALANGLQNVTSDTYNGSCWEYYTSAGPACDISWFSSAAFVNWLNTSKGYPRAYNLNWANGAWTMSLWPSNQAWTLGGTNLFRNAQCRYFLPSDNEWYKAAYYDPNLNGGGYWPFTTGSSNPPTAVAGHGWAYGGAGTNFNTVVYGLASWENPADVTLCGGLSPYGTMGQGGNVRQWVETTYDGLNSNPSNGRSARGYAFLMASSTYGTDSNGWFPLSSATLNSEIYQGTLLTNVPPNSVYQATVGFRVASIDSTSPSGIQSGLYNGLIGTGSIGTGSAADIAAFSAKNGFLSINVGSGSSYTGILRIEGKSYPFSGNFGSSKTNSVTVSRPGKTSAVIKMESVDSPAPGALSGTVTIGTTKLDFLTPLNAYSQASPHPLAGKRYTLTLPSPAGLSLPSGSAQLTVARDGSAVLNGKLPTGGAVAAGGRLVDDGAGNWILPVYVASDGVVTGEIVIPKASGSSSAVSGTLAWLRAPNATAKLYKSGFLKEISVSGVLNP